MEDSLSRLSHQTHLDLPKAAIDAVWKWAPDAQARERERAPDSFRPPIGYIFPWFTGGADCVLEWRIIGPGRKILRWDGSDWVSVG